MPARYVLVAGTFLIALLLYIDRTCIQVAGDEIQKDLGLSSEQFGWVLSIFTLGYALAQTPSGAAADRYGPRKLLTGVVALWSLLTAVTASGFNFASMMVIRFLFGASEAGAFPGIARATLTWFPTKERGLVTGINFSASRIGGALAMPLMVWLIDAVGWKQSFLILGGFGVIFALAWWAVFRDRPEDHSAVGESEKNYIIAHRQKLSNERTEAPRFMAMVTDRNVGLLMVQYFCSNFTFFFCLSWLFKHVKDTYELSAADAGLLSSLPLLGGAAGNWFSGWLVDWLYKTKGLTISRRATAISGFVLATVGLLVSLKMESAVPAVIFLTLAVFGADMTLAPSWSACVDIGGRNSGAVSGTMNMAGNIGAFVTSLAFPYMLSWFGSSTPFFFIAAGLNAVAAVVWLGIRPQDSLKVSTI